MVKLAAFVILAQFLLGGLQNAFHGFPMLVAWWVVGLVATVATLHTERYLLRQRGKGL